MAIATVNPATGEVLKTFEPLTDAQLEGKLQRAVNAFAEFRHTTFASRAAKMLQGRRDPGSRKGRVRPG